MLRTPPAALGAPEMRVPTGSPAATRVMLSGWLRSNTTIGRSFSMHRLTAVASRTLSWSRSRSRVVELSVALGVGVRHRVAVVDAVDLGRLEQDLGVDLDGAQGGRRVGREVRVAGAGHEHRDAALLEVADRAAPDVRLGDLVHRDRGHDPGRHAGPLEGVLEGQAVHDRREHADVVAGRAVHARAPRPPGRGRCCRRRRRCRPGRRARGPRATWSAMNAQNAGSTPYWRSPSSASPDSLSRIRL